MRSSAVLSVAFVTAAVTVTPSVIAVPTPVRFSPPSFGIGPVLTPGFCSTTGACERDLQSRAATAINNTVQQSHLTQDEANKIMQLLQSNEGVQFLQGLETDIAPLLKASGHTNGTENHHLARSSKTAVASAVFGGIGSLSTLANVIISNLHQNKGNKREVDYAPAWERDFESRAATTTDDAVQQGHLTQDEVNKIMQLLQSDEGVQFLQGLETDIAPLLKASGHTNGTENHHLA
ncbi:hypothetical protein JVU11DRAFT_3266 [Chiua virens]|nr:hypothetical protein JVU11DRAFT_3266 [Chiua virens]